MSELDRVRWSCRRGLLELDLVLERFVTDHYERLSQREKDVLRELLKLPDNDLLDLAMGRADTTDPEYGDLIKLMRV
ncbi:MAG: succinate dehydrogenase assembly factor 2 [Betaproteobacteria bacterium]|jgi:antitoxin CptB